MILLESSNSAFRKTILTRREQPSIHFNISCFFPRMPFGELGAFFSTFRNPIFATREHLGRLFWHLGSTLGGHFSISGAPWEAMLAPRAHPGGLVNDRIFVDFGVISGLAYFSFSGSKCLEIRFIFKLVSRLSFYRFLTRIFDVWDFQIAVFEWKVLQKSASGAAFLVF